MNWLLYHIGEDFLIAFVCLGISMRAISVFRSVDAANERHLEIRSRIFLLTCGFILLSLSGASHAQIHMFKLDQNLLYQTLLGYCLGLFTIILAISSQRPWTKRTVPFLYIPLLALLIPGVYEKLPLFAEFRPIVWIAIAYLSGTVSILYIAAYHQTGIRSFLHSSAGHLIICASSIMLFFPTGIGSPAWLYGHLLRPLGFVILFFSMTRQEMLNFRESILYKMLAAFSLLAAIPLLVFGMLLFYENINPVNYESRRMVIFVLMLITLAAALMFGLVMIIRLVRPIIRLKDTVNLVAEGRLQERIRHDGGDEIGDLSNSFNEMLKKLRKSFQENDQLSRLAATGELAATLAHEIKNPLNAIGGAATYIGKNFRGKLIGEFIKVINDEVIRINNLSTSLLNFAKPTSLKLEQADVNRLVAETISLLEQEFAEQNVHLRLELDKNLSIAYIDQNQIKQVLINLLLNAIDASGDSAKVSISTKSQNGNVLLSVRDEGPGISEENMDKIFNPFFTTKTRGTGIGLSISRKIVKAHGGDITVDSAPDSGSTFTVVLPKESL